MIIKLHGMELIEMDTGKYYEFEFIIGNKIYNRFLKD